MRGGLATVTLLLFTAAACTGETTVGRPVESPVSTATSITAPPTAGTPDTTIPISRTGTEPDAPSCLDFWSEALVQTIAGPGFSHTRSSADGSRCEFTGPDGSIATSFRAGDRPALEAARDGATSSAVVADMENVCDTAWITRDDGPRAEGLSGAQGRIFAATVTGLAEPAAVASELLSVGCNGPAFVR